MTVQALCTDVSEIGLLGLYLDRCVCDASVACCKGEVLARRVLAWKVRFDFHLQAVDLMEALSKGALKFALSLLVNLKLVHRETVQEGIRELEGELGWCLNISLGE